MLEQFPDAPLFCPVCAKQLTDDAFIRYCKFCEKTYIFNPPKGVFAVRTRVVTMIGSMSLKDRFLELEKTLTLEGNLVLMPFLDGMNHKESYSTDQWEFFMLQAFKRIELAQLIYVVCNRPDGTQKIGEHTQREIAFTRALGKELIYV